MTTQITVQFESIYAEEKKVYNDVDSFLKYLSHCPIITADLELLENLNVPPVPAIKIKGEVYPRFVIRIHENFPNLNLLKVAEVLNKRKLWWIIVGVTIYKADGTYDQTRDARAFLEQGLIPTWTTALTKTSFKPTYRTTTVRQDNAQQRLQQVAQYANADVSASGPTSSTPSTNQVTFYNNAQ